MKTVRDTGKYHVIEASILVTNSEYLLQMQLFSKVCSEERKTEWCSGYLMKLSRFRLTQ